MTTDLYPFPSGVKVGARAHVPCFTSGEGHRERQEKAMEITPRL